MTPRHTIRPMPGTSSLLTWVGAHRPVIGRHGASLDVEPQVLARQPGAYRPSTAADIAVVNDVWFAAASVKGPGHHEFNKPRQDGYGFAVSANGRFVVASVADGVSEAPLSHLAADLACHTAAGEVAAVIDAGSAVDDLDWASLTELVRAAIRRRSAASVPPGTVTDPSELDRAIARQVMSTTLDVVVVDTCARPVTYLVAALAGDGSLYELGTDGLWSCLRAGKAPGSTLSEAARRADSADADTVFDVERTEAPAASVDLAPDPAPAVAPVVSTEVRALPRDPGPPSVLTGTLRSGEALLACTDGIGDPLGSGDNLLGRFLARAWRGPVHVGEFLRTVDFVAAGAIDDRTAVVVWAPSN